MTYLYQVDGPTYLERQGRARAIVAELNPGHSIDVAEWTARMVAVLAEVDPLPLVVGSRYRIRALGGSPGHRHLHAHDGEGRSFAVDVPVIAEPEYLEVDGRYRGRTGASEMAPGVVNPGMLLLEMDDGNLASIADVDVLRCEEVA